MKFGTASWDRTNILQLHGLQTFLIWRSLRRRWWYGCIFL